MVVMNSSGHVSGKTLGKLHSLQFQLCPLINGIYQNLPLELSDSKIKQVRSEAPRIVAGRNKGSINRAY